jgi:hypothetical protein
MILGLILVLSANNLDSTEHRRSRLIGYEDCDIRCNHDMPMYKYVCFGAENTRRRFFVCGCKVGHLDFFSGNCYC